ncbi:MAG: universal stress protein [Candidatus Bathyarchaeota archaeon]|jgi:nucleotide-binding universal stress UspA family protein|nr:universal stress protein [Candidatus Bathyarchaeota archaeon]
MFKKILVAIDGSAQANLAFDFGVDLAKKDGAELLVLTVVPPLPVYIAEEGELSYFQRFIDDMEQFHNNLLTETIRDIKSNHMGLKARSVLKKGEPSRNIIEVAKEEEADLIILGNRGIGGILSWMLGSTSKRVADACTVPVLIVKDREYCEA